MAAVNIDNFTVYNSALNGEFKEIVLKLVGGGTGDVTTMSADDTVDCTSIISGVLEARCFAATTGTVNIAEAAGVVTVDPSGSLSGEQVNIVLKVLGSEETA